MHCFKRAADMRSALTEDHCFLVARMVSFNAVINKRAFKDPLLCNAELLFFFSLFHDTNKVSSLPFLLSKRGRAELSAPGQDTP